MCNCRMKRNDSGKMLDNECQHNHWLIALLIVVCIALTTLLVVLIVNRIATYNETRFDPVQVQVVNEPSVSGQNQSLDYSTPTSGGSNVKNIQPTSGIFNTGSGSTSGSKTKRPAKRSSSGGSKATPSSGCIPTGGSHHIVISNDTKLSIAIGVFVSLLVCYIVAKVRSKQGVSVLTANVYDKWLILISPVLFFMAWCIGFDHKLVQVQYILLVLSALSLLASLMFSFTAKGNVGNAFSIIVSILAKIFIFVLTFMLLILLIVLLLFTIIRTITGHENHNDGTFMMEYDEYLNRWVGYRID